MVVPLKDLKASTDFPEMDASTQLKFKEGGKTKFEPLADGCSASSATMLNCHVGLWTCPHHNYNTAHVGDVTCVSSGIVGGFRDLGSSKE